MASVSPVFGQQSGREGASVSFSFSGQGNGPIEVRGPDGKVIEVLMPSQVRLNQAPAHVLERERARREKRREENKARREVKKEEKRVAVEEAAEAALLAEEQRIVAAEKAAQLAAEQAEKPLPRHDAHPKCCEFEAVEADSLIIP